MKKLILVFFLLSTIGLFSFEDIISLKEKAYKSFGKIRIDAYCMITEYYYITDNPDSALHYSDLAINNAKQLNLIESKIDAMNRKLLVYSFYRKSEFSGYQSVIEKVLKNNNYKTGLGYFLAVKAINLMKSDLFQSIMIFSKSIKLASDIHDSSLLLLCYSNLGDAYRNIDNKNDALKYMFAAMTIYNNLAIRNTTHFNNYLYANTANSLGIIYKSLGDYDKAINYYKIYLSKSIDLDEKWGISIAYNNIGNIYYNLNKYDEALNYYLLSAKYFENKGIHTFDADIYKNLGNVYWNKKNYKTALEYYEKFKKAAIIKNDSVTLASMYLNNAEIFNFLKKYNEAKKYYFMAVNLAYNKDYLANIYLSLSDFYECRNDSRNSLIYYKKYTKLKDSITSMSKTEELGSITANYEIQKKLDEQYRIEKQRQESEQSNLNRRNLLEYFFLSILIIFLFSVILIFSKFRIPETVMEISVFIFILLLFEFANIICNPYFDKLSKEPVYQLLFNFVLALILSPLDTIFDKYLRKKRKFKKPDTIKNKFEEI